MSDLISKSKLIRNISKVCGDLGIELPDQVIDIITAQPISYDVEKVEKQIEEMNMNYFLTIANTGSEKLDIAYGYTSDALNKAIDIVKKGGVE